MQYLVLFLCVLRIAADWYNTMFNKQAYKQEVCGLDISRWQWLK
jgi:hypothetical protein